MNEPIADHEAAISHTCTNCGHIATIVLAVLPKSLPMSRETKESNRRQRWLDSQPADIKHIIQIATSSGLLKAFLDVVGSGTTPLPVIPEKHFLTYLSTAKLARLSPTAQLAIANEFKGAEVLAYQWVRVVMIVVDGAVRLFVPLGLLTPAPVVARPDGRMTIRDISAMTGTFNSWIKTRMGYVPTANAVFLSALRQPSIGAFARASS